MRVLDGARLFPDTSWTLLNAVRAAGDDGQAALDDFVHRYHRPAFGYIMAIVGDAEIAEGLTQAFFTKTIVSGRLFARYDHGRGSFRPYLKQALRNFITDWRRSHQKSACAATKLLRMDTGAEMEMADPSPTADQALDREWVRSCLAEAFTRVRAICEAKNQNDHFAIFEHFYMSEEAKPFSWDELAAMFGLKDGKQARHRADTVVRHFRLVLLAMLVRELGSEEAARAEITTLLEICS